MSEADLSSLPPSLAAELGEARRTVRSLEAEMRVTSAELRVARTETHAAGAAALLGEGGTPVPGAPGLSVRSVSVREFRTFLASRGMDVGLAGMLRDARAKLASLVAAAREAAPGFLHDAPSAEAMLATVPEGGALVAFMLTPWGSVAWVLPHGAHEVENEHAVPLPESAARVVPGLLVGGNGTKGWVDAYLDWREGGRLDVWQQTIERVTRELWPPLLQPVEERLAALGLAAGAPLVLIPHGALGLLPLHAAWRETPTGRRALIDDYTVRYAPSVYALSVSQRRCGEPARVRKSLIAVADPSGNLPYTRHEVSRVAALFPAEQRRTLTGSEATESALVAALAQGAYVHLACHGTHNWRDVMQSGLELAGDSRLTLARVQSPDVDLTAARLVMLSACETGLADARRAPDEYLGFPTGFLEGGAPAVVSTLWAVDDLSTSLLVEEFYRRHLLNGDGIAEALRGAQAWLRAATAGELGLAERWEEFYKNSRNPGAFRAMRYYRARPDVVPFASPHYWAAFTFTGA
jgi:CHAT domain-containing protein